VSKGSHKDEGTARAQWNALISGVALIGLGILLLFVSGVGNGFDTVELSPSERWPLAAASVTAGACFIVRCVALDRAARAGRRQSRGKRSHRTRD
jgi:hypothetical protein